MNKKTLTTLVAILFLVVIGHQCHAQNQGLGGLSKIIQGFGGNGSSNTSQAAQGIQGLQNLQNLQGLSGLLGGGNSNSGSASSLLGGLPNLLGGGSSNSGSTPNLLGGLPNLLSGGGGLANLGLGGNSGQTSQLDLLGRINQKSKEAIDRTTSWAQQKKQQMTSKMFSGALDRLKPKAFQTPQTAQGNGLLQGASGALDWLNNSGGSIPLNQPPIRSAENYGQQPSLRY